MNEQAGRSLADVMVEAIEVLTKFSIPLYVNDAAGRPVQYGTGFFVRAENEHFLVSAAHVLDVARDSHVYFYATPNRLRYLTGKVLTTGHPDTRDEDMLDVAVMRLTHGSVPPFPEVEKFAMDVSYLTVDHQPRSGKHYAIIGFPATKSRSDPRERVTFVHPYAYRSDSIDDAAYAAHGVTTSTHVVLPLNRKKGVDASGRLVTFPKPQGMSGSPIVVLYDVGEQPGDASTFPVVAVGTRFRSKANLLIGADVRFVQEMIRQHLASGERR